ncbi:SDR family NAD(P)-dependent oxidoreductase [Mycolicibacterium setense]
MCGVEPIENWCGALQQLLVRPQPGPNWPLQAPLPGPRDHRTPLCQISVRPLGHSNPRTIATICLPTSPVAARRAGRCSAPSNSVQGDVTDESDIVDSIAKCHDEFGRIDVMHNNAGIDLMGLPQEVSTRAGAAPWQST